MFSRRFDGETSLSALANGGGFKERAANDANDDDDDDDDDFERSLDFEYEVWSAFMSDLYSS